MAVFLPGKSHGQRSLAGYRPWIKYEVTKQQQQSYFQGSHTDGFPTLMKEKLLRLLYAIVEAKCFLFIVCASKNHFVSNVKVFSIFDVLPKRKMGLKSQAIYLWKWKNYPVFPFCCREKPCFSFLCFYSRCVSFSHSQNTSLLTPLFTKCVEVFFPP